METKLLLQGLETLAFICVSVILISQLWLSKKEDKRLPGGSFGLPVVGETLKYMASMKSSAPAFMTERKRKFGEMFKSKLMGAFCVVSTNADTIKWILARDGKQFVTGYPKSFRKVLGEYTALSLHGEQWKSTRRFLVNALRVELLKERIPMIEERVVESLASWSSKGTLSIREETKTVSAEAGTKLRHG
jgi:(+)-abscisic acid 8'-hydroxylase